MDNYENIPVVEQPKNLSIGLYKHQLSSIYNMEKLENEKIIQKDNIIKETSIGILADQTGFGKSLSLIGLILRDKMIWNLNSFHNIQDTISEAGGRIKTHTIKKYIKLSTNLLLTSSSIVHQWIKELSNTTLKYIALTTIKKVESVDVMDYDIVIVTPNVYNILISSYSNNAWKRFIFDEPGHVKVCGMKCVIAGFYWFITATPNEITKQYRNSKGFMKEIIGTSEYNFEDMYSDMIIKNDPNFISKSFKMPPTNHKYYECFQPVYNLVNGFVSSSIHNMIEAGNIEGAIISLGGKKTDNILDVLKNKKLEELEEIDSKIRIYNIRNDENKIKEWTERKNHINKQIIELDNRFNLMLEDECSICQSELCEPVLEPECQNLFCGSCILKWFEKQRNCPLCRSSVNMNNLIYVKSNKTLKNDTSNNEIKKINTKLDQIIDIIKDNFSGKYLIFSSYSDTFIPICKVLEQHNISYSEVKGSTKNIEDIINKYKKGSLQVIFLNSSYDGAGLNLQETTDIILYHEMNVNTTSQIIGRANRIGRTFPLYVHHLQIKR